VKSVAEKRSAVLDRVFLSHSHKDRWIARQCARLIEEAAKPYVEVFFDEKDIEGGQSIPDSVRTGIEGCDEFVVLLSPYSKDRPWVLTEVGAAWVCASRVRKKGKGKAVKYGSDKTTQISTS
jgi:hypothetical protein